MTLRRFSRGRARDTAWALFGLVGPTGMQLLYVVVAARALGLEEFGQLMLCVAVSTIVMTLAGAGSGGVAMKSTARRPEQAGQYFGQTIVLTLLTAPVLVPAAVGIMVFVSRQPVPWALAISVAVADVVLWRVATTCQQIFIALGQQPRGAIVGLMTPFARFVVALLILLTPGGVSLGTYGVAYLVSTGAAMAGALLYTTRQTGRPVLSRGRFRWSEGFGFALLWLNNTVQVECDKLILSWFASVGDVGVYALASRLMDGAFAPPRALKNVLQARMFREGAAGHHAIFRFSLRILPIVAAYGVLAWIGIVVLAPVTVYVFGERYAMLAAILPAMGALPLLRSISDIGGEVFIASDQVGLSTAVQVFGTAVRIVAGILLVRSAGLPGAVEAALLATAIAGVVFWGSSWWYSRRQAVRPAVAADGPPIGKPAQ